MRKKLSAFVCISFMFLLSACGGGGGGGTTGAGTGGIGTGGGGGNPGETLNPARGFFNGSSGPGQEVVVVILGDGSLYAVHADEVTGDSGVLFGNGTVMNGRYDINNGVEFNFAIPDLRQFVLSATYQPRSGVRGEVIFDDGTADSFDLTYNPLYDEQPSLERLAGSYTGDLIEQPFTGNLTRASMTILQNGDISGSGQNGCGFTGKAAPRSDGNVYDISIVYDSGPCSGSYSGIAIVENGTGKFVSHLATNSSRSDVFLFFGEE